MGTCQSKPPPSGGHETSTLKPNLNRKVTFSSKQTDNVGDGAVVDEKKQPSIHDGTGAPVSGELGVDGSTTAPKPRSESSGTVLLLKHGMSHEEIDRNKAQNRLCDLAGKGNTAGIRELLSMHKDLDLNNGDYDRRVFSHTLALPMPSIRHTVNL